MKAEAFERISQQAESLAERRPRLYRGLLVAMAVAGYAYIGLVLLVLLGLVGGLIAMIVVYETGDLAASRQWRFSAEDASQEAAEMEAERANLTTSDRFTPHDLDAALVEGLRERVAAVGDDLRAYLVRRKIRHSPEVPCYVLAIRRVVPWWKREDSAANVQREREVFEAVLKNLSASCDLRVFIVRRSGLLSRIARVKGARIC